MVYLGEFVCQSRIFCRVSLKIINFVGRISEAAIDRGHYIFRVPRSSFRVRRSSVGSSITQKEARSSDEYSIAQKVAA